MGRILGITFALILYSTITAYLGMNLKKWLEAIHVFRWPIIYWIIFFVIAFGFLIGRVHPFLSPMSIVGNYWMFFLSTGSYYVSLRTSLLRLHRTKMLRLSGLLL